jgi:hypothetical protein
VQEMSQNRERTNVKWTQEKAGKPLLNNTPWLGNPSQDHRESNQTRRTTTTATYPKYWWQIKLLIIY